MFSLRRQGISNHVIDYVEPEQFGPVLQHYDGVFFSSLTEFECWQGHGGD